MAFTTIYVTPGLTATARRRARRSGPRAVASSRREQDQLLRSAGFVDIHERNVTAEFAATARAWLTEREAHADELAALEQSDFGQRQRDARKQLAAVEDGLLRRGLFSAMRPERRLKRSVR